MVSKNYFDRFSFFHLFLLFLFVSLVALTVLFVRNLSVLFDNEKHRDAISLVPVLQLRSNYHDVHTTFVRHVTLIHVLKKNLLLKRFDLFLKNVRRNFLFPFSFVIELIILARKLLLFE